MPGAFYFLPFIKRYQKALVSEAVWTGTSISRLIREIAGFLEFRKLNIEIYT
jgi:hypothetical protein